MIETWYSTVSKQLAPIAPLSVVTSKEMRALKREAHLPTDGNDATNPIAPWLRIYP